MTDVRPTDGRPTDVATRRRLVRTGAARVCVVGQGYVGLSLAAGAAVAGLHVDGVDVDAERVAGLAAGRNVVPGVDDAAFALAMETGRLAFGTDMAVAARADVVVVCVPTPVREHRPDLSAVESAGRAVARVLRPGTLVVLESTTFPGTTEDVLRPLLEESGLRAGRDFLLAYSPERIDPGNTKYGLRTTPRVVGGHTPAAAELAAAFYGRLVDEVRVVSSCRSAELAKLLENTFRSVNIALVNELAMLAAAQGIDVWEVIDAAATKPFGFMPFYPGPGVGGHCIPLDPTYLAWQSHRDTGKRFRLVELAQDVNAAMPEHVADRVVSMLNDAGRSVRGASLLALGVTYKPDVGDLRESAAVEVVRQLARRGARLGFSDPYVTRLELSRPAGAGGSTGLTGKRLTARALAAADAVLLLTPHTAFDLDLVVEHASLVFDARGVLGRRRGRARVVRL